MNATSVSQSTARGPRILLDQSGYHLLNLGDIAMLQGAVTRLRSCWPAASIEIVCHAPGRLHQYCPDSVAVSWLSDGDPTGGARLARIRAALVQSYKMAAPYALSFAPGVVEHLPGRPGRGLVDAIRRADLVVAAGGGYINDSFWWHGAGVLSVIALAQSLGKPTAMFGQGIGPLNMPVLRRQSARVLPRVDVLGLREGVVGPSILRSFHVTPERVTVTGDDAVELLGDDQPLGEALGANLRVAAYSEVSTNTAREIAAILLETARARSAPIIGLPVSRYPRDSDLGALRTMFAAGGSQAIQLDDFRTPAELMAAAARCRIVVTGSYHAATLALIQGVSCVCVSASAYYDQKFQGLAALFPGVRVINTRGSDYAVKLRAGLAQLWDDADSLSSGNRRSAQDQLRTGRAAYARLKQIVDGNV